MDGMFKYLGKMVRVGNKTSTAMESQYSTILEVHEM